MTEEQQMRDCYEMAYTILKPTQKPNKNFQALKEWQEKLQRLQSDNERLRDELQKAGEAFDALKALQSTHNPE